MPMENNFKKTQNYPTNLTNQGPIFGKDLEKSTKILSSIHKFLLNLGVLNLMILTILYFQKDISFRATGWFSIPENIHWYIIFLLFILVRMLIVFTTQYLTEYIKNFSLWTEKEKKNALNALAVFNLLTLPINLPLIGSLYAYLRGSEILSNNFFLGTFRRILTEDERKNLYNETVKNFLEKIKASKEIKNQLKNWAFENNEAILKKYDNGSAFATEYLSENLEIQKKFLELEELNKHNPAIKIEDVVDKTTKDSQELLPWVYEKTTQGLNYFNPWVTDVKTCAFAWILLVGTVVIISLIFKSNFTDQSIQNLTNGLKDQDIKTETLDEHVNLTDQLIKELQDDFKDQDIKMDNLKIETLNNLKLINNKFKNQKNKLDTLLSTTAHNHQLNRTMQKEINASKAGMQGEINEFQKEMQVQINASHAKMQAQINESQDQIHTIFTRMEKLQEMIQEILTNH